MAKSRRRVAMDYRLQREFTEEEIRTIRKSVGTFRAKGRKAAASIELPASDDEEARKDGLARIKNAFDAAKIEPGVLDLESVSVDPV